MRIMIRWGKIDVERKKERKERKKERKNNDKWG